MVELFSKKYHPPGTPPGTLLPEAIEPGQRARMFVVQYGRDRYTEREIDPTECDCLLSPDVVSWVHVQGPPVIEQLKPLAQAFDLHPLALEDVVNGGQRPKVEGYDTHLFLVLSVPEWREDDIEMRQTSLFLGCGFVLSFHAGAQDPFVPIRQHLRARRARMGEHGADYLLYLLTDLLVDRSFPLLESYGEQIEELETSLLESPEKNVLPQMHRLRRDFLLIRRQLWPCPELLHELVREEHDLIAADTRVYFRDVHDHALQILDLMESYREMSMGMIEVYLSSLSHRLNDVMRVLTIIATVFMPLSFVVGVYGMNFSAASASPWAMPELHWYYGYPLVWLLIIAIAVLMLAYFRRKRWL